MDPPTPKPVVKVVQPVAQVQVRRVLKRLANNCHLPLPCQTAPPACHCVLMLAWFQQQGSAGYSGACPANDRSRKW